MDLARNDAYTSFSFPWKAFLLWLVAAVALVASGVMQHAPAQAIPATIATLTIAATALLWRSRVPLPALVTFHAWRVIPGAAFLVLYSRGLLPFQFAVLGGIGDIVVGLMAPFAARGGKRAIIAFSIIGFLDLAFVLRAALLATLAEPSSMALIRELPLGLLPTFAVPISLTGHILAIRRARSL
jgi:hypothetical protein